MTASFPLAGAVASRLEHMARTGSTNADLRAQAGDAEAWPHLSVLITHDQAAGRGRLDRTWVAPAGSALAISVLIRHLPTAPTARGWIPLAAGAAMAAAVAEQLPGHDVAVKWPNDVLVDGFKICGILAEATTGAAVVGHAVLACSGVDALDPETTEVALALATVPVRVDQGVDDLLLGLPVEARTLTAVAGGALEDDPTLLVGVDRPLDSCHFPVFLSCVRRVSDREASSRP